MVSLVGADSAGTFLLRNLASLGIPTHAVAIERGATTPTVVAVFDRKGEVAACVADVAAVERHLSPDRIRQHTALLQRAPLVVLDANLAADSLAAAAELAAAAGVPVLGEPVSVPKSERLVACLRHLHYITPNTAELVAMAAATRRLHHLPPLPDPPAACESTTPLQLLESVQGHLAAVLAQGVKAVVLTMGAQGAALVRLAQRPRPTGGPDLLDALHLPAPSCKVVSLVGAGDCLVAGMVAALLEALPDDVALARGMAAAACCVESSQNVPRELSAAYVWSIAERILPSASQHRLEVRLPS